MLSDKIRSWENKVSAYADREDAFDGEPVIKSHEIVSFDEMIMWYRAEKEKTAHAGACLLSVKPNPEARSIHDKLIVRQILLDVRNMLIASEDGKTVVSRVLYAGTIDAKFIAFLDGEETKIFVEKQRRMM
jgi:hypothetical protein